jgi:hypothetical protein
MMITWGSCGEAVMNAPDKGLSQGLALPSPPETGRMAKPVRSTHEAAAERRRLLLEGGIFPTILRLRTDRFWRAKRSFKGKSLTTTSVNFSEGRPEIVPWKFVLIRAQRPLSKLAVADDRHPRGRMPTH